MIQTLEGSAATARQAASALMQAIFLARDLSDEEKAWFRVPHAFLHFHDASSVPLAWNDIQAIRFYNEYYNANLPVPLVATEGYNQHGHTSDYDGGWIPGRGLHDHRDNNNGGFAFAVFHPGTALPQQPWAL